MAKYVLKRIGLMLVTLFIIVTICFVLIKLLPQSIPEGSSASETAAILARWEALGYNEPILVQYGIYLKNIFTAGDFGTSWYIQKLTPAAELFIGNLPPTMILSVYSLILSIPLGIALGIFAAIKKNKWQDHAISTGVMLFISVPSYVTAFLVQYLLCFKLGWFPLTILSLEEAGGSWFSITMFVSMIPAVLSLSFFKFFMFNIAEDGLVPIMSNSLLKEAIDYAIDCESMLYNLYSTTGVTLTANRHDSLYDVERAKELLLESGYDLEQTLYIGYYNNDQISQYFMDLMVDYLEKIGLSVAVFDSALSGGFVQGEDISAATDLLAEVSGGSWFDGYSATRPQYYANYINYAEFEALVDFVYAEFEDEERQRILSDALAKEEQFRLDLFTFKQSLYINTSRLQLPSNMSFGNVWYRQDLGYANWSILKEK